MAQVLITTKLADGTNPATTPIIVKVGFQPGKVEVINRSSAITPVNAEVLSGMWQYGMANGSVLIRTFNAGLVDLGTYSATNGITLIGFPTQSPDARFGAVVSAFTNANPGVLTVDTTVGITAGCVIKVEGIADDQTGTTLNGTYTVASVTGTTITTATNTAAYGVWVSGGYVSVVTNATPVIPNPPYNIYSPVQTLYNQAIQGIIIGTALLTNADASDVLLISVWER